MQRFLDIISIISALSLAAICATLVCKFSQATEGVGGITEFVFIFLLGVAFQIGFLMHCTCPAIVEKNPIVKALTILSLIPISIFIIAILFDILPKFNRRLSVILPLMPVFFLYLYRWKKILGTKQNQNAEGVAPNP